MKQNEEEVEAWGHGGGGLGSGSALYFIPSTDLTFFLSTNYGIVIDGPILKEVETMLKQIIRILGDKNLN
ncbi:hypothetical protein BH23BAC1_BH23BAC1_24590 [soil metagenome]